MTTSYDIPEPVVWVTTDSDQVIVHVETKHTKTRLPITATAAARLHAELGEALSGLFTPAQADITDPLRLENEAWEASSIGQAVRRAREMLGHTVIEAADRAAVSPTTWHKVEGGSPVRPSTYAAVDRAFGLPAGTSLEAARSDGGPSVWSGYVRRVTSAVAR